MKTKKLLSFIISLAMFLSILPINHISVSAASFDGAAEQRQTLIRLLLLIS